MEIERAVAAGFEAMAVGDWPRARDEFTASLEVEDVPEALLGLANASYWLGDLTSMMESLERAYATARRRGDSMLAGGAALALVGYYKQFLGNATDRRAPCDRRRTVSCDDGEVPRGSF